MRDSWNVTPCSCCIRSNTSPENPHLKHIRPPLIRDFGFSLIPSPSFPEPFPHRGQIMPFPFLSAEYNSFQRLLISFLACSLSIGSPFCKFTLAFVPPIWYNRTISDNAVVLNDGIRSLVGRDSVILIFSEEWLFFFPIG